MLLLDIGNSRIKWARADGDGLAGRGQLEHRGSTLDGSVLSAAIDASQPPERILAGSVAGSDIEALLSRWARGRFGLNVEFLTSPAQAAGVRNAYARPQDLGIDRWLAVVAAFRLFGAAIVVDAGTALTVDVVDGDGNHLGGLIAPGAVMMKRSLLSDTQRLREADDAPDGLLAGDTAAAIASGAHHALIGLVEHVTVRMQDRLTGKVARVITGGDARTLAPALPPDFKRIDDLVLRGLHIMATESGA